MKRKILVVALAAIMVLSMFACSAKSQSSVKDSYYPEAAYEPSDDYYGGRKTAYSESAAAYNYANYAGESLVFDTEPADVQKMDRKIIKTGSLSIEALEYDNCLAFVKDMIEKSGGYIEYSKDDNYRKDFRSCSITARIPQQNFDAFMEGAMNAGNVTSKTINANDITESYTDTESRLKVLKDEKEALMNILNQAETVEDLMYVQNRLYDVIEEIESYEARLRSYDSKINYSKVEISIKEVEKETPVEEETWAQEFKRRVVDSLENFWEFLKGLGIGIVVILPWLIIPAIIVVVVIVIIKVSIKRKRTRKAKAAEEAAKAAEKAE